MRTASTRGATLFEVIITTGLFSLMVVTVFVVLKTGLRAWNNIESRHGAQRQLRRVELLLIEDLKGARVSEMRVRPHAPSNSPMSNPNGHAVWFLSPRVPSTPAYAAVDRGQIARDGLTGEPIWQTNILYYLTVPAGYSGVIGNVLDTRGIDVTCPRKMLVKLVIDQVNQGGAAGAPFASSPQETILSSAQVDGYALAPTGYDLSAVSAPAQPRVVTAQILADQMLYFGADPFPWASPRPNQVKFYLRAMRLREAENERSRDAGGLKLGEVDVSKDPFTIEYVMGIIPGN